MKRRPHGMNLDDGVELLSAEDFDRLYVAARPEEDRRILEWLDDPEAGAMILAGQIGMGKTTFLNKILRNKSNYPMVRVEFDKTPQDETQGAFLSILFGSLLKEALDLGGSFDGIGITLPDFGLSGSDGWEVLRDLLLVAPTSIAKAHQVYTAYEVFNQNVRQVQRACVELIDLIKRKIGALPPIIAEGVDKFAISHAGYLGLAEVLDFLREYKTLYEANAIHLFDAGRRWVTSDKLFIGPLTDETIVNMYERRLGSYAPLYRDTFYLLAQYAGGNARQALRLLNSYYFQRIQRSNDRTAALAMATHRVMKDLLQLGFTKFPANTLAVFKRDGYVEGSLLSEDIEHRQEARDILYRNWAFLRSDPVPGTTRWPLFINPLVNEAIAWEKGTPEPPELTAVRQWAKNHHISPMGLSMPEDDEGRPRWKQIWEQLMSSESSEDELNIVRLLEEIASSLFSVNRQDRIMVSYRNPQNLNIALDYLIGKASAYGPFLCHEIRLIGGGGNNPVATLLAEVKEKDEATIYGVFMEGEWTSDQLGALEYLRDRFIDVQMLWFVEHNALLRYLPHWPQFRQLLRFYVLEDDFLSTLTKEEIIEDLSVLSNFYGPDDIGLKRLGHVLHHLDHGD